FSFLLSIPIILGSSLFAIIEGSNSGFFGVSAVSLLVGFVTAFVTGLVCVKFMLKLLQSRSMTPFAVYLTILVVFLVTNRFFLHLF
ncbi:MAG: undecaprenyl-diphosphatase, partial [Firmicutes bacterium]|nr:undecaprenyl-diphosphatase [Bacillota bacterium]